MSELFWNSNDTTRVIIYTLLIKNRTTKRNFRSDINRLVNIKARFS